MEIYKGYDFEDVLLYPKLSTNHINSRSEVVLTTILGNLVLPVPIIASPMKGIVGVDLISKLSTRGCIGILHRFHATPSDLIGDLRTLKYLGVRFGASVGLGGAYKDILDSGASIVCIDVANGYLESIRQFTYEIANYIKTCGYKCEVMAGNVASITGAESLYKCGATIIRVGIGSGRLCTTRNKTGVGVPQLTAIEDCSHRFIYTGIGPEDPDLSLWVRDTRKAPWAVVADGGIKNSGDAVKALAAGADAVMLGSIFGTCLESEHNGSISGMASRDFQNQFYGSVKKSVEGITLTMEKEKSLDDFLDEFVWNIKSAFTYLNSKTIEDLHRNAAFVSTGKGSIREE